MPDLSFVTTDEMIDEMAKRHRSVIVAYVRDHDSQCELRDLYFRGSHTECVGLARYVSATLERGFID